MYLSYAQGYLEKKLHVRKRSVIPALGDGNFIELEKLYDLDTPSEAFHSNPKQHSASALACINKLLVALEKEHAGAKYWIEQQDPNSGVAYWYNTASGASQWQKP